MAGDKNNPRILCFVDESGMAGDKGFALGCVVVWARKCAQADKVLSDLLPDKSRELHAAKMKKRRLQALLTKYAPFRKSTGMVLVNHVEATRDLPASVIYAQDAIASVKTGLNLFQKENNISDRKINNVELIFDRNHHNTNPEFLKLLDNASKHEGRFMAVNGMASISSAASRLLQLADVVAHSRTWLRSDEDNMRNSHEKYGIYIT